MEENTNPVGALEARFRNGWYGKVECGEGWWPMLAELDAELAQIVPGYELAQVKEKFGLLRFYVLLEEETPRDAADRVYALISVYEARSGTICEACGERGENREVNGWYSTKCEKCRAV